MSANTAQLSRSIAPAKARLMLLVRWLLVLVIAMDLISSPFHAHHHESGPEGYSSHAGQLDAGHSSFEQAPQADELSLHVDSDDADHGGGHSLSALPHHAARGRSARALAPWSRAGAHPAVPNRSS
ncbi:MAG: hypothetical protein B7Z52_00995 [Burkholderiales bacterium 12-64-5]|nr:MAG: hypothetical protein B7Z52_00995 [Burkholderiales bacterium 12-64-5]